MSISEIQLFQALKNKLGESEAENLVAFAKEEVKTELDNNTSQFATTADILRLDTRIADLTKTIYLVGLTQFLAVIGSILLIFNFMLK